MTDNEMTLLMEQHKKAMADRARSELEGAATLIDQFTRLALSKGLELDSNAFSYTPTVGIVATAPGLARTLLGITPTEKDGLFSFEQIAKCLPPSQFQEGCFVGSDYIVMADACFRRSMNPLNNWAPRFIALFWKLNSPNIAKYIAIDESRIRIDVEGYGYMEADTWYGAPFHGDISKINNGVVKLRPPLDLDARYIELFFADTYCLDIKWSESKGIKTFQALELKTHDDQIHVSGQPFFPARYLHAEFDLSAGVFRHLDGAIQLLTEDEYFIRRESDFNIVFKNNHHIKARSKKVFKLNGSLSVDLWVELCCHFFAANPLTFEYFTGRYPNHVAEMIEKVKARKANSF